MDVLSYVLGFIFHRISRAYNYCIKTYQKKCFKSVGKKVYIGTGCSFTYKTISIGDDVSIGQGCHFHSAHGEIIIGNHVMFGPGVHIHGGNHVFDQVGVYMKEINVKTIGDDGLIIIEDDCWIGAKAIILKGVKIGRGSIIGAGSIVTKDVPPYSIYSGVPMKRIRPRWDETLITKHEKFLNERRRSK